MALWSLTTKTIPYASDTNLQAVRDIWASDDGFQDTDGNDLDAYCTMGLIRSSLALQQTSKNKGLYQPARRLTPTNDGRISYVCRVPSYTAAPQTSTPTLDATTFTSAGGFIPVEAHFRQRGGTADP